MDKYFVFDLHRHKDKIRAIIWHVKDDVLKSEYTVCVNTKTWDSYCTCIGWQMRKKACSHLNTLFEDKRYKELLKNERYNFTFW
jgi:hypothetical protein